MQLTADSTLQKIVNMKAVHNKTPRGKKTGKTMNQFQWALGGPYLEMKRQTTCLEKLFLNHIFDKRLVSKMHKEFSNSTISKQTTQLKINKIFEQTFYQEPLSYHGSDCKASAGDPGSIPGSGRSPGEGNGKPTPVLLPGKSHGQRSVVGYSPCSSKESDMTEWLHSLKRWEYQTTWPAS